MTATTTDPNAPPSYQATQHHFPEELPPRKFTQTWTQRNKFTAKAFFTLHYHSYSFRNRHGKRDIWRRISMWLIMLTRLVQVVLMFAFFLLGVYLNAAAAVVVFVLALIAVFLLLVSAWNVALIGDVVGTRRAVGMTVRRNGLDWFLHVMASIHVAVTGTSVLWNFWGIALSAVHLLLGIILLVTALMASTEPVDQYGMGDV